MPGLFISLEGIEGTGKSTQARLLAESLRARGFETVLTAEPGGSKIGGEIRRVLLAPEHRNMSPMAELLLYAADRNQHLSELILPALNAGSIVITDRYSDSTMAYQGYARGLDRKTVSAIDAIATGQRKPDLTILLDIDPQIGLKRNKKAAKTDRFELEALEFHRRVREGFIEIFESDRARVKMIDASGELATIRESIWMIVEETLKAKGLLKNLP